MRVTGFFLGLLAAFGVAQARVAPSDIKGLVAVSDVIVIARVDRVEKIEGVPVVVLAVERTLKGPESKTWGLLLTSHWVCDISTAVPGERGLFLLEPWRKGREDTLESVPPRLTEQLAARGLGLPHGITHRGRGRMPLRVVGGMEHVAVYGDVAFPTDLQPAVVETPSKRDHGWVRSVPLDAMLEQVHALTSAPPLQ